MRRGFAAPVDGKPGLYCAFPRKSNPATGYLGRNFTLWARPSGLRPATPAISPPPQGADSAPDRPRIAPPITLTIVPWFALPITLS